MGTTLVARASGWFLDVACDGEDCSLEITVPGEQGERAQVFTQRAKDILLTEGWTEHSAKDRCPRCSLGPAAYQLASEAC